MTPFHYVIIRKELSGGAALAQVGHAAGESASVWSLSKVKATGELISYGNKVALELKLPWDPLQHQLPGDLRLAVLGATKEQLAEVVEALEGAGIPHRAIVETDGPLAGMVTSVGLVVDDKDSVAHILGELKPFRLS